MLDRMFSASIADENLRVMKPGDVWVVETQWITHDVGSIKPGDSFSFVLSTVGAACGDLLSFTGHARPGRPTCPGCVAARTPIPPDMIAFARKEPFIHLRKKDDHLRRAILSGGEVAGFCHPHMTPNGFRLGPIFVAPEYRGRGLTRAAYEQYARGRRCIAYIHDGNVGSEKAHIAAGFVKWRRGRGGWTWVREAAR